MFAIVGSGFGLYGYLPAIAGELKQQVILPERVRVRYEARAELEKFASSIVWAQDVDAALDLADGAVLAVTPEAQEALLAQCLERANLQRLIVEKPLARSPCAAQGLLRRLSASQKPFHIGYMFRFTPWGARLLGERAAAREMSIQWWFLADHYRRNQATWKRFHSMGGGPIRFFGIHLIALLGELGYREVRYSNAIGASADDFSRWEAEFSGPGIARCRLAMDTGNPQVRFRIADGTGSLIVDAKDPFEPASDDSDRRVRLLAQLCRGPWTMNPADEDRYASSLALWRAVEEATRFEIRR